MDADTDNALYQLQKAVEKQNELQERANALMEGMTDAMRGLAQEIADLRADLPGYAEKRAAELKDAREAEKGIYATPPAPKGQ